ncbi:hypothetical protein C1646_773361 [Rhizophagus diaphanus]|nr:hypothetical protein C1646_773361 [Rhizophagus diaphanus] [Rhizophagus sp. MUCL 43196]
MVRTRDKKDKNNNNNNNKTKDSSNKRPAQSSSQETSSQGPSTFTFTSQPSADSSAKRTKVSDSKTTMNIDNVLPPPAPQDTTSTSSPPSVDTNVSPSAPASGTSLEDSQHSPSNSADKGKSVKITPPEQERAASSDVSNTAIQSSPIHYYAAAAPHTIDNFWTHYKTNREACDMVDRIFIKYPSYGSKATCQGSGDLKKIVVFFRSKTDLEKAIAMPLSPLHDLQFHKHDPSVKKADEQLRTIIVTDISLFVTDVQLKGAFSRYGIITHCRTHLSKLYHTVYIIFESKTSVDHFEHTHAHVALLAGLPRSTVAAGLVEITEETSAKTANIPFSMNSYNLKPYAYLHFSPAEAKASAIDISCALKSVGLTWHEPDEVSSLCHHCGRHGCNPDACGSSRSTKRPFCSWAQNDKLRDFKKYLPTSHPAKRYNHFDHPQRSNQRPNTRQPPSQSTLNHFADGMDFDQPPPVIDYQQIMDTLLAIQAELTLTNVHSPLPSFGSQSASQPPSFNDHLFTLTASLSEISKTVKLGMEQQAQYLAAHDNTGTK